MTLTEFLLARIAEDEAWVRAHDSAVLWMAFDPLNTVAHGRARMLTECEAKRELITGDSAITFAEREGRGPSSLHRYVMRTLATPYADHPDYRAEWKP